MMKRFKKLPEWAQFLVILGVSGVLAVGIRQLVALILYLT